MTKDGEAQTAIATFTEIGIINQLVTAELQRTLGSNLNPSEYGVLNHFVRLNHAVTPTYLAKAFQLAKPSMTAILAKLEAKGYVAIRPAAKDRRRKFVRITNAGRKAHQAALDRVIAVMRERLAGFDMGALATLLPALTDLRTHLDAARNEADGI